MGGRVPLFLVMVTVFSSATASRQPNIVLIIADDMGWNDVGFHGSSQILTPNIDALAYQGMILNRHYTQPTCSPSRAALLSGRYPIHTGVQKPLAAGTTEALPLNHTLLPQYLQTLGYQTHLVGKWHLGSHQKAYWPTRRGFHSFFGYLNGYLGYFDGVHISPTSMVGLDARRGEAPAWQEFAGHYSTDLFIQESVSIVKKHNASLGPLFLEVSLSAPHTGNPGTSSLQVRDQAINDRINSHISDTYRRLYAGMVGGVDDAVGAILTALKSQNLLNNTIVLFSSDNGAPNLETQKTYNNSGSNWPLRGSKTSCHEGGVRSATAIWSPLIPGGRVFDNPIHISDWLPTLYTAAGGNVTDLGDIDGVDHWAELTSTTPRQARNTVVVDVNPIYGNEAFIAWPYKIVKYTSKKPEANLYSGDSGREAGVQEYSIDLVMASEAAQALNFSITVAQVLTLRAQVDLAARCAAAINGSQPAPCIDNFCLFDLESDPCETTDLASSMPGTTSTLLSLLLAHLTSVVPPCPVVTSPKADPSLSDNYWGAWDTSASTSLPNLTTLPVAFLVAIVHILNYNS